MTITKSHVTPLQRNFEVIIVQFCPVALFAHYLGAYYGHLLEKRRLEVSNRREMFSGLYIEYPAPPQLFAVLEYLCQTFEKSIET